MTVEHFQNLHKMLELLEEQIEAWPGMIEEQGEIEQQDIIETFDNIIAILRPLLFEHMPSELED